jgi:hypothetical protein
MACEFGAYGENRAGVGRLARKCGRPRKLRTIFRTLSKGKLVIACEQPVGIVSASGCCGGVWISARWRQKTRIYDSVVKATRPAFTRLLTREMSDEEAYMALALCNAQGSEAAQQRRGLRL